MPQNPQPILETIDSFLREIASKQASNDPGGYVGKSTHPSADADDNTQDGRTGSRASENESDVKEDHPGGGVDNTSPNSGGSQDEHQLHVGMNPSATGEDHSVERKFKKDKEDPESTHPSHTVEDQGEKYSSMRFPELCKQASTLANEILADFANGFAFSNNQPAKTQQPTNKSATAATTDPTKQAAQARPAVSKPSEQELAGKAGDELANALIQTKQAADKQLIAQTIHDAEFDGDLVGAFFSSYASEKQALYKAALDPAAMGGGMPQDPSMPPVDPAVMAGGGAGGPPMPPDASADAGAAADLAGGGADVAGGGVPPSGGPGGPGGAPPDGGPTADNGDGHVSEQEALVALINALQDMGVPEQELAGAGPEGKKVASAVKAFRRSGKYQYREAKTAKEERLRSDMQDYVRELVGLN